MLDKKEMGDDLCKYCPLEKKGVYSTDGGYKAGCEGNKCDEAYENYLYDRWLREMEEEGN